MTYEELQKVNLTIKTTDIKGKEYAEVNQRIKAFRQLFPMGCIRTNILSLQDGVVTMTAEVLDENGKLLATGTAQEKETSSFINKTSFVENCETSAIGRALGILGIGIDTSVASYEEVTNAINNVANDIKNQTKTSAEKKSQKSKVVTTPTTENPTEKPTEVEFTDGEDTRASILMRLCNERGKPFDKAWAWIKETFGVKALDELSEQDWGRVVGLFKGEKK